MCGNTFWFGHNFEENVFVSWAVTGGKVEVQVNTIYRLATIADIFTFSHLVFPIALWSRYYQLDFRAEAQRGQGMRLPEVSSTASILEHLCVCARTHALPCCKRNQVTSAALRKILSSLLIHLELTLIINGCLSSTKSRDVCWEGLWRCLLHPGVWKMRSGYQRGRVKRLSLSRSKEILWFLSVLKSWGERFRF